ncbi:hypothetical protein [Rheinheimera salexigens]|uniref:Lipoprotein n=1 Tax=Rheinheimera salexigens TaxID=1628148 RepID=A0A1E7Q5F1_9GAMM|nr:hypothetical protein [Rheinheimera salexigens]OEY69376.1 hypothetical protein BI198_07180 [Rheinheimera salexigens]
MFKLIQKIVILLVALSFIFVTGCASNPLGMSDDEWVLLTPTQQFEARKIQDARDEAARVRRAEQKAQEVAEQVQLVELRRTAPLGDVVQCTITNALGHFAKNEWHPAQPISIEMHRSESARKLSLQRQNHSNLSSILHMGFDGLNVKVCRWQNRDCNVLAATEAQFRHGISTKINVKQAVEGTLFCSYPLRR